MQLLRRTRTPNRCILPQLRSKKKSLEKPQKCFSILPMTSALQFISQLFLGALADCNEGNAQVLYLRLLSISYCKKDIETKQYLPAGRTIYGSKPIPTPRNQTTLLRKWADTLVWIQYLARTLVAHSTEASSKLTRGFQLKKFSAMSSKALWTAQLALANTVPR